MSSQNQNHFEKHHCSILLPLHSFLTSVYKAMDFISLPLRPRCHHTLSPGVHAPPSIPPSCLLSPCWPFLLFTTGLPLPSVSISPTISSPTLNDPFTHNVLTQIKTSPSADGSSEIQAFRGKFGSVLSLSVDSTVLFNLVQFSHGSIWSWTSLLETCLQLQSHWVILP